MVENVEDSAFHVLLSISQDFLNLLNIREEMFLWCWHYLVGMNKSLYGRHRKITHVQMLIHQLENASSPCFTT